MRRYAKHNDLRYQWTLTFAEGEHDWVAAGDAWAKFARRQRARHGAHPYLSVREAHRTHGLHLHMLVGQFMDHAEVEAAWGLGMVDVRLKRASSSRSAAEVAASYVVKRFSLTAEDYRSRGIVRPPNAQAYSLARGFVPSMTQHVVGSWEEADGLVERLTGVLPTWRDCPPRSDYDGPFMRVARW